MIDTIVLTLFSNQYTITDPEKFTPAATFIPQANYRIKAIQGPTKKELLKGVYKPRLTLAKRMSKGHHPEIVLKIELSLPKLIFGNNFQELRYKDFSHVVDRLIAILQAMGIATTADHLSNAAVSAIHYSKNIPLTDGSTPYHYISKFKEAQLEPTLDTNQTDYRNEGHSFRWHCNSYEVIFYDKIRDLEQAKKSSKRAMEKDSDIQLNIWETLQKRHKYEVLRMEVRLNRRQKINQLFATLGIKADLTFKKLFKPAISKKILLHYLYKLEQKRPPLHDYKAINDKGMLCEMIFNNPNLSAKQIINLFGLKKLLDIMPAHELQKLFGPSRARSFNRLIAEASALAIPSAHSPFRCIKEALINFKAVNLQK